MIDEDSQDNTEIYDMDTRYVPRYRKVDELYDESDVESAEFAAVGTCMHDR